MSDTYLVEWIFQMWLHRLTLIVEGREIRAGSGIETRPEQGFILNCTWEHAKWATSYYLGRDGGRRTREESAGVWKEFIQSDERRSDEMRFLFMRKENLILFSLKLLSLDMRESESDRKKDSCHKLRGNLMKTLPRFSNSGEWRKPVPPPTSFLRAYLFSLPPNPSWTVMPNSMEVGSELDMRPDSFHSISWKQETFKFSYILKSYLSKNFHVGCYMIENTFKSEAHILFHFHFSRIAIKWNWNSHSSALLHSIKGIKTGELSISALTTWRPGQTVGISNRHAIYVHTILFVPMHTPMDMRSGGLETWHPGSMKIGQWWHAYVLWWGRRSPGGEKRGERKSEPGRER